LGGVLTATGIATPTTSTVKIPGNLALLSLGQGAANNTGGSCTMTAGTTCTLALNHSYTTPVCVAIEQGTSATVIAASCSVSGTTVTVTAATSNSATFGFLVFGNPN